jgi:hypothetical protein
MATTKPVTGLLKRTPARERLRGTHPTQAKFPRVAPSAGHYESFYLRACHPAGRLGVWIRYTVHKRPQGRPQGSLWFTLFDASAEGPVASKVTVPEPATGTGAWIRVGDSRFGEGEAVGAAPSEACDAAWELRFRSDEQPFYHLPARWMYRARLPRTKLLSPLPLATFDGRLTVDGRELAVDGWPGMVGHNWGAQHAERWIWIHGLGFADQPKATWLDLAIGRVAIGPVTTPWIANGALSLEDQRLRLGGPGRRLEVDEGPDRCEFAIPGRRLSLRGTVGAPRKDFVGWIYADPDGPDHNVVNCSIADMQLSVERPGRPAVELRATGSAAYELGMRERDHGVQVQPFPDG